MSRITLNELARRIGATLRGDPAAEVTGCGGLEKAGPGEVSFLNHPRYIPQLATTRAGAVGGWGRVFDAPVEPPTLYPQ